jgi:hypothetical protein
MVVKIPINRGKTTSEKDVLESPGTKTTLVTNEHETPCRFGATEAKLQKKKRLHNSISSNANEGEGDVGDNSSISSRSSMNSAPSIDRDVRDGVVISDGGKLATDVATANTTTAAASSAVLSSEDYSSMTVCSPSSDQSREHIDQPYSSPDTLLIGVSVIFWYKTLCKLSVHSYSCFFFLLLSMIGSSTTPKSRHIQVSQFQSTPNSCFPNSINY